MKYNSFIATKGNNRKYNEKKKLLYDIIKQNIFLGTNKTNLVEMVVYGCVTDKINKMGLQDITKKEANQILNANKIKIKTLPE